ncbi:M17 family peptidase N-terminal domain-containing protein [Enhygromyxa salina]|uniref:Peptidase M17 leucyl aminopeptidase N-terminal domain-containing protein n=1 Tax=Enhygromyxa salina TaxID=215803 RepID=A0A2S9YW38_9BACT|nr:M17 family peptidase N-terminal domain-containing protein [Enhygromyxa salina]PRQ09259.1 hypothetical protein ENSA7_09500 [Enhygromyxa salina]
MIRAIPPGHLVQLIRVEVLERALLDGVTLDDLPLDEIPTEADEHADRPGADGERVRVDLGLVPVFSDERPLLGLAGLIDWRGSGRLSGLVRSGFCTAAAGEQVLVPCDRRLPIERLVLVGLGDRASFDEARARTVAEQLVKISTGLQARTVLIALPTVGIDRALTEALFEGLLIEIEQLAAIPDPEPEPEPEPDPGASAGSSGAGVDEPPTESTPDPDAEPPSADSGSDGDRPGLSDDEQPVVAALESPEPSPDPDVTTARWWVAVDQAVVARLRRVLSGPPRPARGGASLHT